jgi:hypothetical protein
MSLLAFTKEKNFPMSKENLDNILEQKFMTSSKFSMEIENLMMISDGSMNYIECIVHYCSENNIEIETVSKLISKPLKEKLKYDAQKLNYIKKTSKARLAI